MQNRIRKLTAARHRLDAQLYPLDIRIVAASVGMGVPLGPKDRSTYASMEAEWGDLVDEIAKLKGE
jgi:hypothetical protein